MQKYTGKLSKALGMFYAVIVVGSTRLYTFGKMNQSRRVLLLINYLDKAVLLLKASGLDVSVCSVTKSCLTDSVQSYGRQPTRLLRPQDSLGKNTGVGCHFLLQARYCFPSKDESHCYTKSHNIAKNEGTL